MVFRGLRSELENDPLGRGYTEMSDEEVLESLSEANIEVPDAVQYTIREYFRRFGADETLVASINAVLPTVGAMITDFGGDGGMDFSSDLVRGQIDQLVAGSIITSDQGNNLKALGRKNISRKVQLGINGVRVGDIQRARR